MGGNDNSNWQLRRNYFSFSLEALGQASASFGWRGHSTGSSTGDDVLRVIDPLAGAGGRLCASWMRPVNEDQSSGDYSGFGISLCASSFYDHDGGFQVRPGARFFFFTHDGRLRIPLGVDYIYRQIPVSTPPGSTTPLPPEVQHGAVLSVGLHYYFFGMNESPVIPYVGVDLNLGGVGGNDYGGFHIGLIGAAGVEAHF